jgi:hypothetical protein
MRLGLRVVDADAVDAGKAATGGADGLRHLPQQRSVDEDRP